MAGLQSQVPTIAAEWTWTNRRDSTHFGSQHCTPKCFLAYVKDQMVYASSCCCVPLPFSSLQFSPPFSSETSPVTFFRCPAFFLAVTPAEFFLFQSTDASLFFISSLYPAHSDNKVNAFTHQVDSVA